MLRNAFALLGLLWVLVTPGGSGVLRNDFALLGLLGLLGLLREAQKCNSIPEHSGATQLKKKNWDARAKMGKRGHSLALREEQWKKYSVKNV